MGRTMNTVERLTRALKAGRASEGTDDASGQRILDAGLHQLELFGLRRTTMEDIARRAGVSRVTVYRYFSSKDELLDAVLLRELSRHLDELRAVLAPLESDEDRIVEGFGYIVRALRGNVLLQRLVRGESELVLPQLTTEGGSFLALIRSFLTEGLLPWVPEGVSRYEVTVMAEITVRLLVSFLLTPETAIELDDPQAVRAAARRYVLPFLGTRPT
jgi:AcrR family transcriptional regulator